MTRREFIGSALCAALAGCRTGAPTSAADRLRSALDLAKAQLADGAMRGVALGTDGVSAAAGLRTFDPVETSMTVGCRFDVASVTKPLVAAAAARLAADGRLDPEAPFTRYLPGHVLGANCRITVTDLATHASGYENLEGFATGIGRHPDRGEFLAKCLKFPPEHDWHWRFYYCCQNYVYLGLIVEELTGRRLDEACRELVFDPLGMSETRWGPLKDDGTIVQQPPEFVNTPNAVGEINDERAARCGFPVGNAGVFTTVGDLLKFTGDLARRERFPREYYDLLQRPAFRWEGKVRSFGFDMSPDPALTAASPRAVRHSGYTGQTILADPETGVSAVVLTSRNCPHKDGLRNRNLLINRLIGAGDYPKEG